MARLDVVSFRGIESRDRHGPRLVCDVDHPHESIGQRRAFAGFFVGYDHDIAVHELPRNRQSCMNRRWVGRRPVIAADVLRLRHVVYIQDDEAAMPVAGVEPVATPDRMVTLMRRAFPGRRFAAADPLTGHPPAAYLFGPSGILQIEDHRDAPDMSLDMRRDVSVAAVEGKSMHAAVGLDEGDLFWLLPIGNIVDFESGGLLLFAPISFQIHEHDIAADANLMRMHALGNFNLRDNLRM